MADTIVPGPCASTGCPSPTEIDCIAVDKVYDFCCQVEDFNTVCTPVPSTCTVPSGATVTCSATATCQLVGCTPVGNGFSNCAFAITVYATYQVIEPTTGLPIPTCTTSTTVSKLKTVQLYAPAGTTQQCEVEFVTCGPCGIIGSEICCDIMVCLCFESTARVKLLVPTYGFCTPAACTAGGVPSCPPSFPTQRT